jgi:hypothetical protein
MERSFRYKHVLLPVVHVKDTAQALRNASLARNSGADGCFLINHDIRASELCSVATDVLNQFKDWWIGLNCLGILPDYIFKLVPNGIAGIWTDNAEVDESPNSPQLRAKDIIKARANWKGLYFGGVAFKYQSEVRDVKLAAQLAKPFVDVVTTSGPGTGQCANPSKIRDMHDGLDGFPLALASGVTPENVTDYLPYVDYFLVSTGISKSFFELDEQKCSKLAKTIHAA